MWSMPDSAGLGRADVAAGREVRDTPAVPAAATATAPVRNSRRVTSLMPDDPHRSGRPVDEEQETRATGLGESRIGAGRSGGIHLPVAWCWGGGHTPST